MSKEDKELYFVAIIPDEPLFTDIVNVKKDVAEKYSSKAALKSPPHITLYMPFRWKESEEEKLKIVLKVIAQNFDNFCVELDGFSCFKPRVIFIAPKENEILRALQKSTIKHFKMELNLFDKGFETRPFHPHITIAFRDLKKPLFFKAWDEEFSNRPFKAKFQVKTISLLKHNGKSWDIYESFELKGYD